MSQRRRNPRRNAVATPVATPAQRPSNGVATLSPYTPGVATPPIGRAHAYASHKGRVPSVAGGDAGAVPMPPLANGLGVAGVGYLFALRRGRGVPA